MHPSPRTLILTLLLAALVDSGRAQQRIVIRAGGAIAVAGSGVTDEDGPAVEMFESPNLDRFLRRARQFLQDEKFKEAILLLQAVIEGRTLEAGNEGEGGGPTSPPPANTGSEAAPKDGAPKNGADNGAPGDQDRSKTDLADPAQTVFSADGRIYRPARRLCHEYLAGMPTAGIELYRVMYERLARDLLARAQASGNVSDFETVANRYFPTLAGGQAMQLLADRQMHDGQFRAAVQVLRDLAELYPQQNLRQLGISPLWCRFKIALCLRLSGETGAAREAAAALAAEHPDESLRIMGELQPVRELPASALFADAGGDPGIDLAVPRAGERLSWLAADTTELVPLWQYRFAGPDPYSAVPTSNDQRGMFFEGSTASAAPPANKYGTGTQIAFFGRGEAAGTAVFLENFRLRVADAFTGLVVREGDGDAEPKKPIEMRPRARVPAYDFTLLTPAEDNDNYYVVVGRNKIDSTLDSLKVNNIVAYDKELCRRQWSTEAFQEGREGLADVTFLASPTVFGERLLVPTLRRGAYELQCLDRRSGRPLWHTRVHSGGSPFFKAPGAHVQLVGNLAVMLTNAGAIAAIDAFAGDLRWIRKYERTDPVHQRPVGRRDGGDAMYGGMTFIERDLTSFLPSEVYVIGGTIVFAGCDSEMLLCLDAASGEPVWMVDGMLRYGACGRIRQLVGHNSRCLYAEADQDGRGWLVCIEVASGVVRWAREVPGSSDRLSRWRGRGCVLEDFVCMPGDREILVLDADGRGEWRRLQLPPFGVGDEPLRGSNNLYSAGPWLGVAYARGLEVYSAAATLRQMAQSTKAPLRRAELLVQSGDIEGGLGAIEEWLRGDVTDPELRRQGEERAIELARDLSSVHADLGEALERVQQLLTTRSSRQCWHLARLDFFQQRHDLRAYADEQQRLYALLEGK